MKKITYLLIFIPIFAIGQSHHIDLNTIITDDVSTNRDASQLLDSFDLQKENSINAFPNPVKSTLYLNYKSSVSIKKLELYDILGKKINEQNGDYETINMSQYINGVYLLKIETVKQGTISKKIIKQ